MLTLAYASLLTFPVNAAEKSAVESALPIDGTAEIRLFTSAVYTNGKGTNEDGNCEIAAEEAFSDLLEHARDRERAAVVIASYTPSTWDEPTATFECELSRRGQAKVWVGGLVVTPADSAPFPPISVERGVEIAATLESAGGKVHRLRIVGVADEPWLQVGSVSAGEKLNTLHFDRNGRGTYAFNDAVAPLLREWSSALTTIPEISGVEITVTVKSENFATEKEKRKEAYRFRIATADIEEFSAGSLADQDLLDRAVILYAESDRDEPLQRIKLSTVAGAW